MTLRQFAAFIGACMLCQKKWEELSNDSDRKYVDPLKGRYVGYVNLYQICDHYVKPWTRNLGNSIALLMNNQKPLKAEAMISHAWGESMSEALEALLGRAVAMGLSLDTVIWFCTFAQYQPGDMEGDCGPGVAAQLALDPFKKVIASNPPYGMIVLHTERSELYSRLWCVYEVNEAAKSDVTPIAAVSMYYLWWLIEQSPDGDLREDKLSVDSENASCFSKDDEAMIKGKIREAGGFDKLNTAIFQFRKAAVRRMFKAASTFNDWGREAMGTDGEETFERLAESVHYAADFVCMHCLFALAVEHEDKKYREKIKSAAMESFCVFYGWFKGIKELPPCFDQAKGANDVPEPGTEIFEAWLDAMLLDIKKFPFVTGLLEMGAGGNIMADALQDA